MNNTLGSIEIEISNETLVKIFILIFAVMMVSLLVHKLKN